jgi:hypothetical protein
MVTGQEIEASRDRYPERPWPARPPGRRGLPATA